MDFLRHHTSRFDLRKATFKGCGEIFQRTDWWRDEVWSLLEVRPQDLILGNFRRRFAG